MNPFIKSSKQSQLIYDYKRQNAGYFGVMSEGLARGGLLGTTKCSIS